MKRIITLTLLAIMFQLTSFAQCPISGTLSVCVGSNTYLSVDSMSCGGGAWASSSTSVATVTSWGTTGEVTGISAGVTTISYTVGGVTTTAVVTVGAAPAAISGTTTFCVGTTSALTDATSGGTWSTTATWIASINPATGVATGVAAGSTTVYYTVPGLCPASATLTIESSTMYDSMTGPSTVCSGSTITIYTTATGGTWSSSDVAVATVSTSGVVTGVSTGTAIISYAVTGACGPAVETMTVTVNPPVSAGTISGPSTVTVGSAISLYDYSYAGTTEMWESSNPGVATVSTSGMVTGVAAGTVNIEYLVYGCAAADTAFYTVTVTALDGIAGHIIFDTTYIGNVQVWLITFNPGTLDLEAADSAIVYCSGTSVAYTFTGAVTDSYRVKAALYDSLGTVPVTGFVPTYHDSSYHWNTASVFTHTSGTADINKNVYMRVGTPTSGPGFISGNVMAGADKGTSGDVPAVNLLVYVYDATTGRQIATAVTDASGNYSFSNLPVSATYYVYPEAINFATTTYTGIALTSGTPSMTAANFKKHNLSKTIVPVPTGINDIQVSNSKVSLYPNPTTGMVQISWVETAREKGQISVTDVTGREVYHTSVDLNIGAGQHNLDLSGLKNGNYVIAIRSGLISYTTTLTIAGK